jgi:hypothetical protein
MTADGQKLALGDAEIRVTGRDGTVYAAPSLVAHYIAEHSYRPPDGFIEALLGKPSPGTTGLTRDEMVRLVERLQRGEGTAEEATEWVEAMEGATSNPHVADLIFYPKPGEEHLTSEQIVDRALAYRPFKLVARGAGSPRTAVSPDARPRSLVVHAYGGMRTSGDLESRDRACRRLSAGADTAVTRHMATSGQLCCSSNFSCHLRIQHGVAEGKRRRTGLSAVWPISPFCRVLPDLKIMGGSLWWQADIRAVRIWARCCGTHAGPLRP